MNSPRPESRRLGRFFAAPPAEPAVESAGDAPPSSDELFAEPLFAAAHVEELQTSVGGSASAAEGRYGATAPELAEEPRRA